MNGIKDNNQNRVSARGKIISIGRDDYGHRNLTLFINGPRDIRPVYVSFALGTDLPLNITVRSFVKIEGHVVANAYHNDVWDRWSYLQYFVADKIELDKTRLEDAFPDECAGMGFSHSNTFIAVALKGEIANIVESEAPKQNETDKPRVWTRVRLKVDPVEGEVRPSLVNVQFSSNMRVSEVPIHVGDKVCMTALVSTKRKDTNAGSNENESRRNSRQRRTTRIFEDIIVNDLAVIEPAVPETEPKEVAKVLEEENKPEVPIWDK